MNNRSVALRLLAVFLTAGLALTTGLVTASAMSGSAEDPALISVDEKPDADAAHDHDQAKDKDKDKDKADDEADDESGDESDDESDDADSNDDAEQGAPAGESDGTAHEGHGADISKLAHDTEPGPEHGSVVCAMASGGKCQPDHQTDGAGVSDDADEGPSDGHGKGHGKAHAARADRARP